MCIEIQLRLENRPVNHLATQLHNSSSNTHSLACSRWCDSYKVMCDPKIKSGRRMTHTAVRKPTLCTQDAQYDTREHAQCSPTEEEWRGVGEGGRKGGGGREGGGGDGRGGGDGDGGGGDGGGGDGGGGGGGARATLAGASAGAAMAGGGGGREAGEDARSGNHIAIRYTHRQSSGPSQQKDVHALARQGTKRSQNQ